VGQVAPGIGAPSLDLRPLFADINGDGKADYLAVNRNTAAVSAFLTAGLDTSAVAGWLPLGQIAARLGGPNIDIQMADINGDGRADYIAVNTLDGSAAGYLNGGQKTGGWIWFPQPKIAAGFGAQAGSTYRFADIEADGKADYLVVGFLNSVDAYHSIGKGPDGWVYDPFRVIYAGNSSWANFGAADAVHFADIDGDGYADLLVFNNGNVKGLLNGGPNPDPSCSGPYP